MPQSSPLRILILEPDRAYAAQLAASLARLTRRRYLFLTASRLAEAKALLRREENCGLALLTEELPPDRELLQALQGLPQLIRKRHPDPHDPRELHLRLRVSELAEHIEAALSEAAPGGISRKPLVFVSSFHPELRRQCLEGFLRKQRAAGRPVYYFPFLPHYQIQLSLHFHSGPELSSLLLLLANGGEAEAAGLGPCFEMQEEGYLALRQGGRAEDLSGADLETQRRILSLFRRFIRSREEPSVGLLELAGLPFRHLPSLLSFADILAAELPAGNDFAAQQGRREMSAVLASLPATCHFQEIAGQQGTAPHSAGPRPRSPWAVRTLTAAPYFPLIADHAAYPLTARSLNVPEGRACSPRFPEGRRS